MLACHVHSSEPYSGCRDTAGPLPAGYRASQRRVAANCATISAPVVAAIGASPSPGAPGFLAASKLRQMDFAEPAAAGAGLLPADADEQPCEAGLPPLGHVPLAAPAPAPSTATAAAIAPRLGAALGVVASPSSAPPYEPPTEDKSQIKESWTKLMRWSSRFRTRKLTTASLLAETDKVVVFGGGSFGTAMGAQLAGQKADLDVVLLLRDPYLCRDINTLHCNTKYLKVRCGSCVCMQARCVAWNNVERRGAWHVQCLLRAAAFGTGDQSSAAVASDVLSLPPPHCRSSHVQALR